MTVESAASRLAEAEQLITRAAQAVVPGARLTEVLPGRKLEPRDCTGGGLVFYSFDREFQVPAGQTGASLVPAVAAQFEANGFTVHDPGDTDGWPTRTAATAYVGINVLGSPTARTIRIGVDTQCGSA